MVSRLRSVSSTPMALITRRGAASWASPRPRLKRPSALAIGSLLRRCIVAVMLVPLPVQSLAPRAVVRAAIPEAYDGRTRSGETERSSRVGACTITLHQCAPKRHNQAAT